MYEKPLSENEMSELSWAQDQLKRNIAPPLVGDVKRRVTLAAHLLGWKISRTTAFWYADERISPKPKELRDITKLTGVEYGRQERAELDRLIERANTLTYGTDEDFARAAVDAMRAFFGALAGARTGGGRSE